MVHVCVCMCVNMTPFSFFFVASRAPLRTKRGNNNSSSSSHGSTVQKMNAAIGRGFWDGEKKKMLPRLTSPRPSNHLFCCHGKRPPEKPDVPPSGVFSRRFSSLLRMAWFRFRFYFFFVFPLWARNEKNQHNTLSSSPVGCNVIPTQWWRSIHITQVLCAIQHFYL